MKTIEENLDLAKHRFEKKKDYQKSQKIERSPVSSETRKNIELLEANNFLKMEHLKQA